MLHVQYPKFFCNKFLTIFWRFFNKRLKYSTIKDFNNLNTKFAEPSPPKCTVNVPIANATKPLPHCDKCDSGFVFFIIKKSKMISQVKPGPDLPSTIRPVPAKAAASRPFSAEIMPDISRRHKMVPALSVDRDLWLQECEDAREYYEKIGKVPPELYEELDALEMRLNRGYKVKHE